MNGKIVRKFLQSTLLIKKQDYETALKCLPSVHDGKSQLIKLLTIFKFAKLSYNLIVNQLFIGNWGTLYNIHYDY